MEPHEFAIVASSADETRAECSCHRWSRAASTEDLALEGVPREEVLRRAHREHLLSEAAGSPAAPPTRRWSPASRRA